jgi:hypothetical protein
MAGRRHLDVTLVMNNTFILVVIPLRMAPFHLAADTEASPVPSTLKDKYSNI